MMVFQRLDYEIRTDTPDEFGRDTQEYGQCIYRHSKAFLIPLISINIGVVCLAILQTWRARNLSTEFAESKYIANALFISLIASLLTFPIAVVVQDQPNIATFISVTLIFILTGSVLCSIFIPKIIYFYQAKNRPSTVSAGGSGAFASSLSHFGSSNEGSDRFSMGDGGERILTTKSQKTLTKEIKDLTRELAATKKRERLLKQENDTLQKRLQNSSSSTHTAIENDDCYCSSGDQNVLSERINTNGNNIHTSFITSKNTKKKNVSFSDQSTGSLRNNGVSFSDDMISVTRKQMVSFDEHIIPEGSSVVSSTGPSTGPSDEFSCHKPKVLINMGEKLHPPLKNL